MKVIKLYTMKSVKAEPPRDQLVCAVVILVAIYVDESRRHQFLKILASPIIVKI